jgi:hypothetical protein
MVQVSRIWRVHRETQAIAELTQSNCAPSLPNANLGASESENHEQPLRENGLFRRGERSLRFYVEQLGFSEDWAHNEGGHVYVCQVSLLGFEVILNEINDETQLDSNTATAPA